MGEKVRVYVLLLKNGSKKKLCKINCQKPEKIDKKNKYFSLEKSIINASTIAILSDKTSRTFDLQSISLKF